jgi:glutathione peroxidase
VGVYDDAITLSDGSPFDLSQLKGRASLIVNVASKCGLTPQYEGLQRLYDRYRDRGFTVLGLPCNQFSEQEPGDEEEILAFCTSTYGVTFPITEKIDVNGRRRHPMFAELAALPDSNGRAGDVWWNFEKFLVAPDGTPVARFRPRTDPEADEVVAAIEGVLPAPRDATWITVLATDARPGDRMRLPSGTEMTITRVEESYMGSEGRLGLIEDSDVRWLVRNVADTAEIEVLRA